MALDEQLPRPTDAELEILAVLWSIGPATVRQVYDEESRAHVYKASRSREWTQRQLAGHLLERAFSGSAKALLIGALSAKKTSKSELAELQKLLDEYAARAK